MQRRMDHARSRQPATSFPHDRGVNVQAARAIGPLPVSQSPSLVAFANAAPRNLSTSAAESPVLSESPARPVMHPRKLSEAAKEKLDAVWADAIYDLHCRSTCSTVHQYALRSTPPPTWYSHSAHSVCRVVPASFDAAGEEFDAHEGREAHSTRPQAARCRPA